MFSITTQPINPAPLIAAVESPSSGALVVFEGRVRNHHLGKDVIALNYTSHPTLAQSEGQKLVDETLAKFPDVEAIAATHRTGYLEVGEKAVVIAVSSPHRPAAFAACDYLAAQLKNRLPVWKEEHFADGEVSWTK
ncbi:molybdenum cofactor biosynthesis protein MoaE [Roseibacillus persicicus]|uniref:molybdenum cofactor biosynthesis protein MoaE n=1 Tax=Roseibacillus persicicus TaxID=454148 RepID=UPI00280F764A|nr:molybdenum cofactor biosynthesis protein MoaE [Roseibacillus persicicus]MDQ8190368.1 molybdenum cofactor biosynthesis protein MoaE [Roseibacillus persicicus]